MHNPNRASTSFLILLFIAVITLMVWAPYARAGGMLDGISACRDLQASTIPIACKFDIVDETPTFYFGLTKSDVALSPEEFGSLIWDVVQQPCASKDIAFAVLATLDGVKSIKMGLCVKGKLTIEENWRPLDTQS